VAWVNSVLCRPGLAVGAFRGTIQVTGGTRPPRDGAAAGGRQEHPGGTPAPASATYETVNLFGRRTGHRIEARRDEILPTLPRGFVWIAIEAEDGSD
jgi:hypothetical protein